MNTAPLSGTQGNQEVTKQNHPFASPKPDSFDKILQIADFGTRRSAEKILDEDLEALRNQESEPIPNWLRPDKEKVELPESPFDTIKWLDEEPVPIKLDTVEGECNLAVHIPPYLRPINLSARDEFLKAGIGQLPDWLEDDDRISELPSWLTASGDDDLFAQNGLPQASRNTLPDWMRDSRVVGDSPDWLAEAREVKKSFDPNETQKTTAVKRHTIRPLPNNVPAVKKIKRLTKFTSYLKNNKSIQAFLVLIFTIGFGNIITSLFPTILDNIVADIVYIALYKWLASIGYDAKDIFLHSKQ